MSQILHEKGPVRLVQLDDGRRSVEVNLESLGTPKSSYYSDWYTGVLRDRIAHFTFGKMSVAQTHLVTVLDIPIAQVALLGMSETIQGTKSTFLQGLETFVESNKLEHTPPGDARRLVSAATKEHAEAATFSTLGYNDNEASLVFYRMPPTVNLAKLKAADVGRIEIFPVVRVDATASILLAFCRDVIAFSNALGPALDPSN